VRLLRHSHFTRSHDELVAVSGCCWRHTNTFLFTLFCSQRGTGLEMAQPNQTELMSEIMRRLDAQDDVDDQSWLLRSAFLVLS